MARHALGVAAVFALLALQPGAAAAQAPSAEDLAASTEVLDASEPEPERAKPAAETAPAPDAAREPKFEITWTTLATASGGEPETNLQLDESGWRVEDLLRPRRHKLYPSTALSVYG